ncbi:MAG: hypothetical protein IPP15_03740 [Saprospiraceae bacterium]|uniref:Uncharacterized protein n=1 Tax=Candidatus Opimibacter skivensis TaxID=2982028 RepID=A0A9D7STM9_9BACT|nr:hypothetical protein [Candidatus Opimibacter skivensis]
MKLKFLLGFFLFLNGLSAQTTESWNGTFEGNILGVTARLIGHQSDRGWAATIDANNYMINIQGSIAEMQSSGTISDPQRGTSIPYEATLNRNQIILKIEDINPNSGQMEKMEFAFTRIAPAPETNANQSSSSGSNNSADNTTHDQSLLGTWRYTESYVSGDFSFATDWFLWVNADGSFQYSDGRTAGGGSNSSIDSGNGDVHNAKWKTENKSIFVDDGNGWQFYAKYYKEDNNLMLTFGNGKRQVWEKIE